MFNKKQPVLTASTCLIVEMVRTALEVLLGNRVAYVCLDLNTCQGKIRAGKEEKEVKFRKDKEYLFSLCVDGIWHDALFAGEDLSFVMVCPQSRDSYWMRKTVAGEIIMRWVGRSATIRWEEPLHFKDTLRYARMRGMTLAQFLASGT